MIINSIVFYYLVIICCCFCWSLLEWIECVCAGERAGTEIQCLTEEWRMGSNDSAQENLYIKVTFITLEYQCFQTSSYHVLLFLFGLSSEKVSSTYIIFGYTLVIIFLITTFVKTQPMNSIHIS